MFYLDDVRLGWKAKGIIAYFLEYSDRPIKITDVILKSSDSKEAFWNSVCELIRFGYCVKKGIHYTLLADTDDIHELEAMEGKRKTDSNNKVLFLRRAAEEMEGGAWDD